MTAPSSTLDATSGEGGRLGGFMATLDRRSNWIGIFIVLATIAAGFVVLEFLARYFQDYFHLILIFFFAWLLAFLVSPAADWLQHRLRHLPRALAVLLVIVPIIVVGAIVTVRVVTTLAESFVDLAAKLPDLAANPPSFITDLQTWLTDRGIDVDVAGTFHTVVVDLLKGMTDFAVAVFGGALGAVGTFVDGLIVITLAVFLVIDRDRILRFGLSVTPPSRRASVLEFRHEVSAAVGGFIRAQAALGGLYGVWALGTSLVFGLPFALATAILAAIIMAIPVYGPYVSWLPPVLVAALVRPDLIVIVAVVMLVGWFIDENILAPLIRSDALDLHPVVVTFAFLLGGQLAGAIGGVIAVPIAAVIQAFVMASLDRYRTGHGWPPVDETGGGPIDGAPSSAEPGPEPAAG
ncbi:MAG TPA: AI-2E family transporter [Candidatus Binatia bacterium]|nr:AI-2E family transporter [Candidatus Binatia bacterium]